MPFKYETALFKIVQFLRSKRKHKEEKKTL